MIPGQFSLILSHATFLAVMAVKIPNTFCGPGFDAFFSVSVGATTSQSLTSDTEGLYLSFPLLRELSCVSGIALKLQNIIERKSKIFFTPSQPQF